MIKLMKERKSTHEKFFSDIILNSVDAIVGFDNDYKIFSGKRSGDIIRIFKIWKYTYTGKGFSEYLF